MSVARLLAVGLLLEVCLLSNRQPAVADDGFRFPSQRTADPAGVNRPQAVARFWERNADQSPVQQVSLAGEPKSAAAPNGLCGHSGADNGKENGKDKLPSWCEAGTLFRWSFDKATGGPNLAAEPLVTDRPDFTEATSTVGRGVAQLEFGYAYFYDREGGVSVRSQSLGEPLLRYGVVANWLEFRAALFPVAGSRSGRWRPAAATARQGRKTCIWGSRSA
jgi:hypothetical protein